MITTASFSLGLFLILIAAREMNDKEKGGDFFFSIFALSVGIIFMTFAYTTHYP